MKKVIISICLIIIIFVVVFISKNNYLFLQKNNSNTEVENKTKVSLCGLNYYTNGVILNKKDVTQEVVDLLSNYKDLCSREPDEIYNFCLLNSSDKSICKKNNSTNELIIEVQNIKDILNVSMSFRDNTDMVDINTVSKKVLYLNAYDATSKEIGEIK